MSAAKTRTIIRTAIYIRVSSEELAKHGDSLRGQLESCQKYIDEGISGQKLDRDAFVRLMEAVRSGEVDFILFTKLAGFGLLGITSTRRKFWTVLVSPG